jgi:hypothetical protein
VRRALSLAVLSLAVLTASGCASFWRGTARPVDLAPSGLPWGEEVTRRALVMGSFEQALARTRPKGGGTPGDALLAALFRGQVAYHAGHYDESATAFAEADRLMEQRDTKSASRGVLSLLVNDHALRYVPPRTERLFARYYAMLARLEAGAVDGAVVEARRLSALLEATAADLDPDERALHAALRDVAGAVFEAAGEWNDAGVAYRNAALLRGVARASVDSIAVTAPAGDSATLMLVVERGFAAHYVARSVAIPLDDDATARVGARSRRGERRVEEATAARWLAAFDALPGGGVFADDTWPAGRDEQEEARSVAADWTPRTVGGRRPLGPWRGVGRWLEVEWPMLVRSRLPEAPLALSLAAESLAVDDAASDAVSVDGAPAPSGPSAWARRHPLDDGLRSGAAVSDAMGADARRLRGARLLRLAARAATRLVAVEAVREEHGDVAGLVAGLVASTLERADTRGWHLLPGHLTVVRLTVPAGRLAVALAQGAGAEVAASPLRAIEATPGSVHVRATRIWRDRPGSSTMADARP